MVCQLVGSLSLSCGEFLAIRCPWSLPALLAAQRPLLATQRHLATSRHSSWPHVVLLVICRLPERCSALPISPPPPPPGCSATSVSWSLGAFMLTWISPECSVIPWLFGAHLATEYPYVMVTWLPPGRATLLWLLGTLLKVHTRQVTLVPRCYPGSRAPFDRLATSWQLFALSHLIPLRHSASFWSSGNIF